MRRSAGFGFVMAMILLMSGTGGFATQDQEQALVQEEEIQSAPEIPIDFENAGFSAAEGAAVQDWQGELDLIADLLIEGKALEAKARTEDLLAVQNLPEDVATRARTLQEKAEARLAEPPAAPQPRPKIEIPPANGGSEETEAAQKAPPPPSFRVREAIVGGGFGGGANGLLRVSAAGLSFTRQGQSREAWTIRWKDLAEARSDDGLWDAPYPLVLMERGGRKRYIAHIDQKGRYLPGQPVLAAISKGRRPGAARQPAGEKAAVPGEGR